MLNVKKILRGLNIIPASGSNTTVAGDIQVQSDNANKLTYNNGTTPSAVVTENHASVGSSRIRNKDLDDTTVQFVNTGDTTVALKLDAAGTTGTSTTILGSQTTDQVQTLQDVTDTFVYRASTDTLTNKSMDGGANTFTNLPTSALTGTVDVAHGGTGAATLTTNNVILGNGTAPVQFVAPGANGNLLTSNGTTWTSQSGGGMMINPMTVTGDIVYGSTTATPSTPERLGIGTTGQVLTVSGGLPSWQDISSTQSFTLTNGQVSPANITGFTVSSVTNKGFSAEYAIARRHNDTIVAYSEDTAFYGNLGTGFNVNIASIAEQSDNKIIVGGAFTALNGNTRNFLTRLNSNGTEDTSFYTNLGTGFGSSVSSIVIQSNGQILVGGSFTTLNGNTRNKLVRLNSDGTEDTTFYTNLGTGFDNQVRTITIQSNGQILVGGAFTTLSGNSRGKLVRLNSNGTEDTTFAANIGTGFGNNINSILQTSNNQILVAGLFTSFNSNTRNRLVRLNSDGTEDTSFYTNLGTGFNNQIFSILLQSDNKIIAGGQFTSFNSNTRNRLVRLNYDGTEDTAFYTNLGTGVDNSFIQTMALESNGQILIGGDFTSFNSVTRNKLFKLNTDGTEDTTFYTNLGTGFNANVRSLLIQSNEQILAGGDFTTFNSNTRNNLVRLTDAHTIPGDELITQGDIRGIYRPSATAWELGGQNSMGDDTGIEFSMNSSGQMQYTSSSLLGTTIEEVIKFSITSL